MKKRANGLLMVLGLLLFGACRQEAESTEFVLLDSDHVVAFLSPQVGGQIIREDPIEGYFDHIRPLDMALQLRQSVDNFSTPEALLSYYRQSLANAVTAFDPRDKNRLAGIFQELFQEVEARYPGLWPDTVQLLQVKPFHLGEGVYFTRQGAILMPESDVDRALREDLATVLLHEVFHLYSRRFRQERDSMYALIQFERPGFPIRIPKDLEPRLLLNPDAVDTDYVLQLDSIWTIPLIFQATTEAPAHTDYLDALQIRYFELDTIRDTLVVREPQRNWVQSPAFRKATGGNTDYIIHPEEILADNFTLLFGRQLGQPRILSERGKQVLDRLDRYLSNQFPARD